MTTIRCTRTTATKLAALMLGEEAVSNPASARDALGELCNMVAGNFKAKITGLADACMFRFPPSSPAKTTPWIPPSPPTA